MSAVMLATTEATKLSQFTGYSRPFISAITSNMENNRLWVDGQYDTSLVWLRSDGTIDDDRLWDHVDFAGGDIWMQQRIRTFQLTLAESFGTSVGAYQSGATYGLDLKGLQI